MEHLPTYWAFCMAKKPASTSLEEELFARVLRIAQVDRRSIAQVIEQCVENGIDAVEADKAHKLEEKPASYSRKADTAFLRKKKQPA